VKINAEKLRKAKITYYGVIDWDNDGVPAQTKLEELDIAGAIDKYLTLDSSRAFLINERIRNVFCTVVHHAHKKSLYAALSKPIFNRLALVIYLDKVFQDSVSQAPNHVSIDKIG